MHNQANHAELIQIITQAPYFLEGMLAPLLKQGVRSELAHQVQTSDSVLGVKTVQHSVGHSRPKSGAR
jgi:hypothetical protein